MPQTRPDLRDTLLSSLHTLKQTIRALVNRPSYSAGIVFTLMLGIGSMAAVFTVVNAILLRPLPYAEPERLVAVWPGQFIANQEVAYLREHARTLQTMGAWSPGWLMALRGIESPVEVSATRVTGDVFSILGAKAAIGSIFGMEAESPASGNVAVLSDELWHSAFDGDRTIVGRSIELDGGTYTVAGVMPPGFGIVGDQADLWTPLSMDPNAMTWQGASVVGIGRLARAAGVESATAEFQVLAHAMQEEFDHTPDWSLSASVIDLRQSVVQGIRLTLLVLSGAVAFLLLIAGANVANLILIRMSERHTELAVRASLGATSISLAGTIFLETLVLAVAGGAGGLVMAGLALNAMDWMLPPGLPRIAHFGLELPVVAVAAASIFVIALVFGLLPALLGTAGDLGAPLRGGRTVTRSGNRSRAMLAAGEIAFAVLLTAGAGLMTRTVMALNGVDTGFRPDHLLTMRLQPSGFSTADNQTFWRELVRQVNAQSGVDQAGTVLHPPVSGRSWKANIEIEGRPLGPEVTPPRASWQVISPGYLRTVSIPLIQGQDISDSHGENTPRVILLNESLAATLFPGESPLGHRVKAGNATRSEWATIIGIVGNVRQDSLNAEPAAQVYVPLAQRMVGSNTLVVRTVASPLDIAPVMRRIIHELDAGAALGPVQSMDEMLQFSLRRQRMVLWLLTAFAALGLSLGAVGVYAVVAYATRQRHREIGIRLALGASPASIKKLIVGQGSGYALAGVLAGLVAALGLTRFLSSLLFGVAPLDPTALIGSAVLFILVGSCASYIPARRAARTDPRVVLEE